MRRLFYFILILITNTCYIHATEGIKTPILFTEAEVLNEYTTRIPFKLVDHLIVIEAQLLNKKGNFIIDTGSKNLILCGFRCAHFTTKSSPAWALVSRAL